jgi:hypothetical protein
MCNFKEIDVRVWTRLDSEQCTVAGFVKIMNHQFPSKRKKN